MNIKEKLTLVTLALFGYLLPFSSRIKLDELQVLQSGVANDFTRVFLFGADILVLGASLILFVLYFHTWAQNKITVFFYLLFAGFAAISLYSGDATPLGVFALTRLIVIYLLLRAIGKAPTNLVFTGLSLGLAVGGAAQSVFALTQFITQKSIGLTMLGESPLKVGEAGVTTFTLFGEKLLRAYGTLPHPNILAFYLCISLLACIVAAFHFEKGKKIFIAAAVLITLGLFVTFSRTFISLLSLILISGLFYQKQRLSKKYLLAAAGILLAVVVLFSVRPPTRDESYSLRLKYSGMYAEISAGNPWLGVGIGESVLYTKNDAGSIADQEWMHQPVHNTYKLLQTETGWLGLGLFFLFLIFATNNTFKSLKQNPHPALLFSAGATGLILLAMFFEHLFITNPNSLYLTFAILGLIAKSKEAQG